MNNGRQSHRWWWEVESDADATDEKPGHREVCDCVPDPRRHYCGDIEGDVAEGAEGTTP